MCVLIYKPKNQHVSKKTLKKCWAANYDGAGFMFADNNKLTINKGYMKFNEFYSTLRNAEKKHKVDFVLHFRISTSGKTDANSCHPFFINSKIGFAHNGILSTISTKNSQKSDTMIFVEEILKKMPDKFLSNVGSLTLIEHYAAAEKSKFIFMENTGNVTIINKNAGIWDAGVWFSNTNFDAPQWDFEPVSYGYPGTRMERCGFCEEYYEPIELEYEPDYNTNCCINCREYITSVKEY